MVAEEMLGLLQGEDDRRTLADPRYDALIEALPWYREQVGDCTVAQLDEADEKSVTFVLECTDGELELSVRGRDEVRTVYLTGEGLAVRPRSQHVAEALVRVTHGAALDDSIELSEDPGLVGPQAAELEKLRRLDRCEIDRGASYNHHMAQFVLACENGGALLGVDVWGSSGASFAIFDDGWNAWRHRLPGWADSL